jgi:hypothetical protein
MIACLLGPCRHVGSTRSATFGLLRMTRRNPTSHQPRSVTAVPGAGVPRAVADEIVQLNDYTIDSRTGLRLIRTA